MPALRFVLCRGFGTCLARCWRPFRSRYWRLSSRSVQSARSELTHTEYLSATRNPAEVRHAHSVKNPMPWKADDQAARKLPSRQSNCRSREANSEQSEAISCHVGGHADIGGAVQQLPRPIRSTVLSRRVGQMRSSQGYPAPLGPFIGDVVDRLRHAFRHGGGASADAGSG